MMRFTRGSSAHHTAGGRRAANWDFRGTTPYRRRERTSTSSSRTRILTRSARQCRTARACVALRKRLEAGTRLLSKGVCEENLPRQDSVTPAQGEGIVSLRRCGRQLAPRSLDWRRRGRDRNRGARLSIIVLNAAPSALSSSCAVRYPPSRRRLWPVRFQGPFFDVIASRDEDVGSADRAAAIRTKPGPSASPGRAVVRPVRQHSAASAAWRCVP
jgi:hypothetical protein